MTRFPYHTKHGLTMSLFAKFENFDTILIGKGYNKYGGEWLEINSSEIIVHQYYTEEKIVKTITHNLVFDKFIAIAININSDAVVNIFINTLDNYFKGSYTSWYNWNYNAFVEFNSDVTDVKFSVGNNTFRRPVWLYGDSYFGVNSSRVIGWLKTFGYFNFHVNGLPGQNSPGAFLDFQRSLNFGTPKYLLWCLGMNDNDTDFTNYVNELKMICKEKNIELILTTIPTVRNKNNQIKEQFVRESGLRYVDWSKAVNSNNDGSWYTTSDGKDYQSTDNVHPSEFGARALAMQILLDFPEIMQY